MDYSSSVAVTIATVLGIAGAILVFLRFIYFFSTLQINFSALIAQIVKLVQSDNVDRALKLCRVVSNNYAVRSFAAILEGYQLGPDYFHDSQAKADELLGIGLRRNKFMRLLSFAGVLLAFLPLIQALAFNLIIVPRMYIIAGIGVFFFVVSELKYITFFKQYYQSREQLLSAIQAKNRN